jgi:hypothetical protein
MAQTAITAAVTALLWLPLSAIRATRPVIPAPAHAAWIRLDAEFLAARCLDVRIVLLTVDAENLIASAGSCGDRLRRPSSAWDTLRRPVWARNQAADRAIRDTTAEAQSALQRANDELAEVRRREAEG